MWRSKYNQNDKLFVNMFLYGSYSFDSHSKKNVTIYFKKYLNHSNRCKGHCVSVNSIIENAIEIHPLKSKH